MICIQLPTFLHRFALGSTGADFWLFPEVKLAMKGDCYDTIQGIQGIQRESTVVLDTIQRESNVVLNVLNAIPRKDYGDCFQKLFYRFQPCIDSEEDYFE
jgi:hypothetical protein